MQKQWFKKKLPDILRELKVKQEKGLSTKEATKRVKQYGDNKLVEEESESIFSIFFSQFQDFMVMVLLVTTGISFMLGEIIDAFAILAIIMMNAILGFIQEYKAEKSLDALKQLAAPICTVVRNGEKQIINVIELAPGDIVLLEAGDRIPADCRLIETSAFNVNEAALTGESLPAEKDENWFSDKDTALGDQENMVFMGTLVTRGRAKGIVVATGMNTEIGRIAGMIKDSFKVDTPLQRRLSSLGRWLVLACLIIVAIVVGAGIWQGFPIYKMFLIGVSLAVAAIPEGLPAVVTIALAVGVQRMIKCNAVIRQLPSVETLGCATVICSDKTGTLTQNKMKVQKYWLAGRTIDISKGISKRRLDFHFEQALKIGSLCNNAEVQIKQGREAILGDPTEGALLLSANSAGIYKDKLLKSYQLIKEVPFDSTRKCMSVLVERKHHYYSMVKGAPDVILGKCDKILLPSGEYRLTSKLRNEIVTVIESFGSEALRVLGLAYKEVLSKNISDKEMEQQLTLVGLVGMIDPPRLEAKKAIAQAKRAGIRTIMVTGDHKLTATAIANQLNLTTNSNQVITGDEWEKLSDRVQRRLVNEINVFARVAPEHKLSIVRALQANGEIVGMTGDGINDAPAVKEADIGISMGITGTDVTKEASAMILADDNFQTIISAIKEGRSIYDNIRKFIRYLLACNVGEVLTMFFTTLAGLPLPLLPIQILWINLVTDGLPAIALGVDPSDEDIMNRSPRNHKEGIFARKLHVKILFTGFLISLCTIAIFVFSLWYNPEYIDKARTLAFTTLVMAQLIFVFQCRSEHYSIFDIGFFGNIYLVVAVALSASMHCLVIYHPWFQQVFRTVSLTVDDWLLVFIFSAWSLLLDTIVRMVGHHVKSHFSLLKVKS